jgi:hypothetical protein
VIWTGSGGTSAPLKLALSNNVEHVEFSRDGRRLVTSCSDQTFAPLYAQVWDAATGELLTPRLEHSDGVIASEFSPDGLLVLTTSEDGSAGIWDAASGKLKAPFLRHDYQVTDAAFSADGRMVVTASRDQTARVWDAASGDPITPPLRHAERVHRAVFSPNGQNVVTASRNGEVRIWDLRSVTSPIADLEALAQLLNSRQIDPTGALVPVGTEELRKNSRALRASHPEAFRTSRWSIEAWHRNRLEAFIHSKDWFAARQHLDQLQKLVPGDAELDAKRLLIEQQAGSGESKP